MENLSVVIQGEAVKPFLKMDLKVIINFNISIKIT
jgi:hypothetical protein